MPSFAHRLATPHRLLVVLALILAAVVLPGDGADASHDPDITIADAHVVEGDRGTSTMAFTVELSTTPEIGEVTTVAYKTVDFSAVGGDDYRAASGTLRFTTLTGRRQTIDVRVNGDQELEGDDQFLVGLSDASAGRIVDGSGVGTIVNDDGPTISVAATSASEGDGVLAFPVSVSAATGQDIAVDWETRADTATPDEDFVRASGTLVVPAGRTQATIEVAVLDDAVDEEHEIVDIVLSNPTGDARLLVSEAPGTIIDDDGAPVLSIADAEVVEGDATLPPRTDLDLVVSVIGETDQPIEFDFSTYDRTATGGHLVGADYGRHSGHRTIPAGEDEIVLTVKVIPDQTPEPDETLTVELGNIEGAGSIDNVGLGTIRNDDAALRVADAAPVTEGEGAASFAVTIPHPSVEDVSATVATTDGSATAPQDYAALDGETVTIPAGQTSTVVAVPTHDDHRDEPDTEAFTLGLSDAQHATIEDGDATGTVTDDDALPGLVVSDIDFTPEGDAGESTRPVPVTLVDADGAPVVSDRDVEVDWATRAGSATDADHVPASGRVVIPAGTDTASTPARIEVTVTGDTYAEPDEDLFVELTDPTQATIADGTGRVTIVDDDETLTVEDVTVHEGGVAEVVVRLGRDLDDGETVTVNYESIAGTAEDEAGDGDYTAVNDGLTFTADQQVHTVLVETNDDTAAEGDEAFEFRLFRERGAVVPPSGRTATVTIVDDDA